MGWLYTKWWKWLCVVLLFYVVIGGMIVPLAPGIPNVSPLTFKPDTLQTFTITGYNTHFTSPQAGKVQLWFKNGPDFYCPDSITIVNDNTIEAKFAVGAWQQDSFTRSNFDVVVNNDVDGTFALREAVTLIKNEIAVASIDTTAQINGDTVESSYKWMDITEEQAKALKEKNGISTNVVFVPNYEAKKCTPSVNTDKHSLFVFPYREILYESVRNTFYHVPMWFIMTTMVLFSLGFSIAYLMTSKPQYDIYASSAVYVALLAGVCGYATGMIWSKYTWFIGMGWGPAIRNMAFQDIKLSGALISVAAYAAYLVLRGSITDEIKRARISAVYNIFAVVIFMMFVFIVPRMMDSLHPGNGGNPAFSKYDLDSHLRMFFYPASIGWIILGFWILSIIIRIKLIEQKREQ